MQASSTRHFYAEDTTGAQLSLTLSESELKLTILREDGQNDRLHLVCPTYTQLCDDAEKLLHHKLSPESPLFSILAGLDVGPLWFYGAMWVGHKLWGAESSSYAHCQKGTALEARCAPPEKPKPPPPRRFRRYEPSWRTLCKKLWRLHDMYIIPLKGEAVSQALRVEQTRAFDTLWMSLRTADPGHTSPSPPAFIGGLWGRSRGHPQPRELNVCGEEVTLKDLAKLFQVPLNEIHRRMTIDGARPEVAAAPLRCYYDAPFDERALSGWAYWCALEGLLPSETVEGTQGCGYWRDRASGKRLEDLYSKTSGPQALAAALAHQTDPLQTMCTWLDAVSVHYDVNLMRTGGTAATFPSGSPSQFGELVAQYSALDRHHRVTTVIPCIDLADATAAWLLSEHTEQEVSSLNFHSGLMLLGFCAFIRRKVLEKFQLRRGFIGEDDV